MENSNEKIGRRIFITGATLGLGLTVASAGDANAKPCAGSRFEIYPSGRKWRWRLFAANGEQIAEHSQPYDSYQACENGISAVKRAHNAPVRNIDSC
ncbi:MAG: YegP family protein [Alphaproteobacteria bacterium]|nr:YegP family protein [Alphaproteobacteria bacterium]